jgi:hypothetical protein
MSLLHAFGLAEEESSAPFWRGEDTPESSPALNRAYGPATVQDTQQHNLAEARQTAAALKGVVKNIARALSQVRQGGEETVHLQNVDSPWLPFGRSRHVCNEKYCEVENLSYEKMFYTLIKALEVRSYGKWVNLFILDQWLHELDPTFPARHISFSLIRMMEKATAICNVEVRPQPNNYSSLIIRLDTSKQPFKTDELNQAYLISLSS